MPEHGPALPTLEQLENELVSLNSRHEELLRERRLFWRLGFSKDRVNLLLRQVESRRKTCEEAIREERKRQAKRAPYGALERGFNQPSPV